MTKHKAPVKFLLLCLAFLFAASAVIGVSAQNETSINTKAGTEQYFTETYTEYVSDFSSAPKGWDFFSKSNAVITNGILTCEEGNATNLGSALQLTRKRSL